MTDRQQPVVCFRQPDQIVALVDRQAHRLFEQQVLPGLDYRGADLVMQVAGQDDVDQVHIVPGEQLPIVRSDRRLRKDPPRRGARGVGLRGDCHKLRAGRLLNGFRVAPTPGTEARSVPLVRQNSSL